MVVEDDEDEAAGRFAEGLARLACRGGGVPPSNVILFPWGCFVLTNITVWSVDSF